MNDAGRVWRRLCGAIGRFKGRCKGNPRVGIAVEKVIIEREYMIKKDKHNEMGTK